jgi:hypothetical protein
VDHEGQVVEKNQSNNTFLLTTKTLAVDNARTQANRCTSGTVYKTSFLT